MGHGGHSVLFDRDREWADLVRFATDPGGPRLGLVYGRRRQGKSFLLRALSSDLHGLYHQALEEERVSALGSMGATIAHDLGLASPLSFGSWDQAIRDLVTRAGAERVVILDEFPFLTAGAPELPSVLQRIYDEARSGALPAFRMILCGSAMSVMTELLAGARPLRGRTMLDMAIHPFDYRTAAAYWSIGDPTVAFMVHAVVGGTPGYRDLLRERTPTSMRGYAAWLGSGVLDPSSTLFSEDAWLLTEDPTITDRSLYQSILAAIVAGKRTTRALASALGRSDQALRYPLLGLERAGLIRRDDDILLTRRPLLRVSDPILRFLYAVVRPDRARFEDRRTQEAWAAAGPRFESQVLGPHFEELCREWAAHFASGSTLGGAPRRVGFTHVNDADARTRFEVDVVVEGARHPRESRPVLLAIGEAKGGATRRRVTDLRRLERLREVLAPRAVVDDTRLLLFARGGFEAELAAEARRRHDVELIDLERLYGGD